MRRRRASSKAVARSEILRGASCLFALFGGQVLVPAALFVFLAAAAGAGVVGADLDLLDDGLALDGFVSAAALAGDLREFKGWFAPVASNYNEFIRALLEGNVKAMNLYMNDVALATFSSFDVGKYVSERTQPERFYHGFVLGLLIEIRDRYAVRSNRESGFGRYDVMLLPKSKRDNAIILEFKVREPDSEKTLEDTVESALDQIIEKKYDAELLGLGITQERIRHYGFAFEGKKVLIG